MSSEVVSSVDMEAPLASTSMGINGLLNVEDVKKVCQEYHLDMKRDKLLKKSQEKRQMAYIFKNFKQMDLRLTETGTGRTKLDYRLTYKKVGPQDVLLLVLCFIYLGSFGFIFFALQAAEGSPGDYTFLYIFFGFILLLFLLWFFLDVFLVRRKRHMDKMFRKIFLTRLNEYVRIADEHQRNAIW